jgi:hypothetical protein
MLLTEAEIQRCLALVKAAFPRFAPWEFVNARNDHYAGVCVWGCCQVGPETMRSPRFFVTFDSCKGKWKGHLSVGKHCYYWSSADVGDAHLLDTELCPTLEQAISALKKRFEGLVAAFLGYEVEPGGPAD